MPYHAKSLLLLLLITSASTAAEKPNILFIAIDDQNDWIGCLGGHSQIQTPHIDALAKRGTVFLNAHCQAPLCNSSRTSLMTGLRPSSTGIYGLAPWFRTLPEFADHVSLPQYLRAHGYKTFTTGKIYHGGTGRRKTDNEFDVIGPPPGVGVRPESKLVKTPSPHPLVDWGTFPHKDEQKQDYVVASWAVDRLKEDHEQPFFLSVGFFLPHVPCYATQQWMDLYPTETLKLPEVLKGDRKDTPRFSWYLHWKLPEPRLDFLEEANEWKNLVRSYMACTSFVDAQIGRVLSALEQSGKADNTIVVIWSDHGWHLGEKRITGKNTLWHNSTRIPLIFAGPGVSANAKCTRPAELLDIFPTLNELCGLPKRDDLEGHSLVPQLQDATTPREFPAITTHNHDNHSIRSDDWRYIVYADGSEELYDMKNDPDEWHNLASKRKYRDIIESHRRFIPKENRPPAAGSKHRILIYTDGTVNWEGTNIPEDEQIPELSLD